MPYEYLCENFTSSQEPAAVSLADSFSDIPLSVLSKLNPIDAQCCSSDSGMEYSRDSRSGMMSQLLMENHGEAGLMSLREDSHAKTFHSPEKEKASPESAAVSGSKWRESFAKFDPLTSSWKIRQLSLFEGWDESLEIWPRWGMMRNGECWEHPMPSGLMELRYLITSAIDALSRLPTPNVCGNYNRKGASKTSGDGLATALRRLPTPTKSDVSMRKMPKKWKRTRTGIIRHLNEHGAESQIRLCQQIADGGPMNPEWVEWFMGWPIGATALQPLETDKFREWFLSHGEH